MDIHISQLTAVKKGILWLVSPDCITGSSVQLIELKCFLKLSTDRTYVLTSLLLGQYIKASVWDFPLMTSLSVNK